MEAQPVTMKDNKINGFDRWDIREAVDTLIKAENIRNDKRKGFYETVQMELDRKIAEGIAARDRVKSDAGLTKLAKAKRAKGK